MPKKIHPIKLIQLNVWTGRLVSCLVRFLQQEKPDILCLQELIDLPGGDNLNYLTKKEIQEITGLGYQFVSPVISYNYLHRKASFGNGIISRFPILKSETIFTLGDFQDNFDYLNQSCNMRNLQHVVVQAPDGKKLNLLNHHGYHIPNHKNGNDETLRQTKMIANYAAQLKGPVILSGDFNLSPTSSSIKQINAVLRNLISETRVKTTRTIMTHKTEVCDYIFVNPAVKVNKFEVSKTIVSDHRALILEFDL